MTTLTAERAAATQPARKLFTVDEYYAMADAGILTEGERVELIEGEIIVMSPIGNEHAASVDIATRILVPITIGRASVRVQSHVRLDENNQPEPDVLLLKWSDDAYRHRAPAAEDVLLLIEVSHASLAYDRGVKLALYARFLVPEVWLANIPARIIEAYTDPVDGEYTVARVYRPGETISPTAFPYIILPVSQIIGAETVSHAPNGAPRRG